MAREGWQFVKYSFYKVAPEWKRLASAEKETGKKEITAVITRFSPTATIRRDYVYSELDKYQQLASGASDEFFGSPDAPGKDIVISSVLFRDMTVEGDDMGAIRGVLEKRRGVKIQLVRVIRGVERLASVDQSLFLDEIQRVKQLGEGLPIRMDDGSATSDYLEIGLREGREIILRRLARLETELRENAKVETYYTSGGQRVTRTEDKEWSRQRVRDTVATIKSLEQRL